MRLGLVSRIGAASVLALFYAASPRAQTLGSQDACPDFSLGGLASCLPGQIALSQKGLDGVIQDKLGSLSGEDRNYLSSAEAAWDAFIGPECQRQGARAGVQRDWTSIAVLECRLNLTNSRAASLMQ